MKLRLVLFALLGCCVPAYAEVKDCLGMAMEWHEGKGPFELNIGIRSDTAKPRFEYWEMGYDRQWHQCQLNQQCPMSGATFENPRADVLSDGGTIYFVKVTPYPGAGAKFQFSNSGWYRTYLIFDTVDTMCRVRHVIDATEGTNPAGRLMVPRWAHAIQTGTYVSPPRPGNGATVLPITCEWWTGQQPLWPVSNRCGPAPYNVLTGISAVSDAVDGAFGFEFTCDRRTPVSGGFGAHPVVWHDVRCLYEIAYDKS